ncbi:hypothetical protein [Azospirillum palustre]
MSRHPTGRRLRPPWSFCPSLIRGGGADSSGGGEDFFGRPAALSGTRGGVNSIVASHTRIGIEDKNHLHYQSQ